MSLVSMGVLEKVEVPMTGASIEELIRQGRFSRVSRMLDLFLPLLTTSTTRSGTVTLSTVWFWDEVSTREIARFARDEGYSLADARHLLALCSADKEKTFDYPFVFLGSSWRPSETSQTAFFPYIKDGKKSPRLLGAISGNRLFGPNWRIAMIHQSL